MTTISVIQDIEKECDISFYSYDDDILEIFNNNNLTLEETDKTTYYYGLYYETCDINIKKAIEYYLKSINLNNTNACYRLGLTYKKCLNFTELELNEILNIEIDRKTIIENIEKYLKMGSDVNHTDCIMELGNYYSHNKNYDKMKQIYQKGMELNINECKFALATYYQYIEKNYDEMKKLYTDIESDKRSLTNLGVYYQFIEINYEKMMELYLKAIELKDEKAMVNLAVYYTMNGDIENGKKYGIMASEYNSIDGLVNLATTYLKEENYDEMKVCYLKAILLGSEHAIFELANFYEKQEMYDEMKEIYNFGVTNNNANCAYKLGNYHYKIENNIEKAIEYHLTSVRLGNKLSYVELGKLQTDIKKACEYFIFALLYNINTFDFINILLNYDKNKLYRLLKTLKIYDDNTVIKNKLLELENEILQ